MWLSRCRIEGWRTPTAGAVAFQSRNVAGRHQDGSNLTVDVKVRPRVQAIRNYRTHARQGTATSTVFVCPRMCLHVIRTRPWPCCGAIQQEPNQRSIQQRTTARSSANLTKPNQSHNTIHHRKRHNHPSHSSTPSHVKSMHTCRTYTGVCPRAAGHQEVATQLLHAQT